MKIEKHRHTNARTPKCNKIRLVRYVIRRLHGWEHCCASAFPPDAQRSVPCNPRASRACVHNTPHTAGLDFGVRKKKKGARENEPEFVALVCRSWGAAEGGGPFACRFIFRPRYPLFARCAQILLLGAGESGKSTFAKQLTLMTKGMLTDGEMTLYRRGAFV